MSRLSDAEPGWSGCGCAIALAALIPLIWFAASLSGLETSSSGSDQRPPAPQPIFQADRILIPEVVELSLTKCGENGRAIQSYRSSGRNPFREQVLFVGGEAVNLSRGDLEISFEVAVFDVESGRSAGVIKVTEPDVAELANGPLENNTWVGSESGYNPFDPTGINGFEDYPVSDTTVYTEEFSPTNKELVDGTFRCALRPRIVTLDPTDTLDSDPVVWVP